VTRAYSLSGQARSNPTSVSSVATVNTMTSAFYGRTQPASPASAHERAHTRRDRVRERVRVRSARLPKKPLEPRRLDWSASRETSWARGSSPRRCPAQGATTRRGRLRRVQGPRTARRDRALLAHRPGSLGRVRGRAPWEGRAVRHHSPVRRYDLLGKSRLRGGPESGASSPGKNDGYDSSIHSRRTGSLHDTSGVRRTGPTPQN